MKLSKMCVSTPSTTIGLPTAHFSSAAAVSPKHARTKRTKQPKACSHNSERSPAKKSSTYLWTGSLRSRRASVHSNAPDRCPHRQYTKTRGGSKRLPTRSQLWTDATDPNIIVMCSATTTLPFRRKQICPKGLWSGRMGMRLKAESMSAFHNEWSTYDKRDGVSSAAVAHHNAPRIPPFLQLTHARWHGKCPVCRNVAFLKLQLLHSSMTG